MKPDREIQTGKGKLIRHRIWTVIGAVLCVILIPVLILNITLIVKSYTNRDQVPSAGGYFPLIVLTDSMYPGIQSGDLIICRKIDANEVLVGDVISFVDPAGNGTSIVTHRVTEIVTDDGGLMFRTKGDANNAEDPDLVSEEKLVGIYRTRIAGAGNAAMFLQTTPGLIICVICPLIVLLGYDMIRRRLYEKHKRQDTDALLRELETLRAQKAGPSDETAAESAAEEIPTEDAKNTPK